MCTQIYDHARIAKIKLIGLSYDSALQSGFAGAKIVYKQTLTPNEACSRT